MELTSKELTALEEQLASEENLVKKFDAMSQMCADPAVAQNLKTAADKHRAHYSTLVNFLQ